MLEFELVLPCYNEAKSLKFLIERASSAATEAGLNNEQFQLVLVENGSLDESSAVLDTLKAGPLGVWFQKVSVAKNQGYGFGLWSGLQSTRAPVVGWSHADQQCDPKDAFRALAKLRKSSEPNQSLVKGVRSQRNWKDKCVSRVFEFMAFLVLRLRVHEMNAQPKVFPRHLLSLIKYPPKTFAFDLYVLYCATKANFHMTSIEVQFPPRIHGVSNWASNFAGRYKTILGMIRYMCDLATNEGRL